MKLTLIMESLLVVHWWIYASYNTHDDYRGQTGCMTNLGKGDSLNLSLKQKLNAKIFTEEELLGTHNGLNVVFWSNNSIEAKYYMV